MALEIFWKGMKAKLDADDNIESFEVTSSETPINILMVGGRRCGKTSVLATIYSQATSFFGTDELVITSEGLDQEITLTDKMDEIKGYFSASSSNKISEFEPDNTPSLEASQYTFDVSIIGKRGKLALNFIDVPGEWYTNSNYEKTVNALVKTCNVLLVAIDTPHLMQEEGIYNEARNRIRPVTHFIRKNFDFIPLNDKKTVDPKMILFVPLKCEKYKEEMGKVNKAIHESYKDCFTYLSGNSDKCVVAITPIFTMEGSKFSYFKKQNRQVIEYEIDKKKLPKFPIYTIQGSYSNLYCEQPLVYILVFMLEYAKKLKEKTNWFGRFFDFILRNPSVEDFLKQKDNLKNKIVRDKEGYQIVQNPMDI